MESRVFCAYNENSKCFLSTRVTVVDAALEPLKVLKVLMEGLAADAKSGLWLIHFKGVPVARAIQPFDLIYLDKDFRVVHGAELSADSTFEPFRGTPSSALILPARTILTAKTRTGHQINFREVMDAPPQAAATARQAQITQPRIPAHSFPPTPASGADVPPIPPVGSPSPASKTADAAPATPQRPNPPIPSGRMTKSAHSLQESSASLRPAAPQSTPEPPGQNAPSPPTTSSSWATLQRDPLADAPNRVVSPSASKNVNVLPDRPQAARPASPPASGRLLKPAPARPEIYAGHPQPEAPAPSIAPPPSIQEAALEPPQGAVVPAAFAAPVPAEKPVKESHLIPFPAPSFTPEPAPAPPAASTPASAHRDFLDQVPPYDFGVPASASSAPIKPSELNQDNALVPASETRKKVPWDVQLLYWAFPEYDPSLAPDFRMPRTDFLNEAKYGPSGKPSLKLQVLSWLYPNLHLENVEKTRREDRAAPRVTDPGLVAYFFTGGAPRPHEVKNISVTGFYMLTDERWLPGTIIRITLQLVGTTGENPHDTITVHSRVVRWGPDGGGFEFVLPGFVDGI
ncbi:MAG TPA: hypothetical protein VL967_04860 [Terracidiphilus sp.]|nr:hypothetical protein [Terracidiphilus sp.]